MNNTVAIEYFKNVDQSQIKLVKHELQYDFFMSESETEVERLIRMTEEIKASTSKVRKKLFANDGDKEKRISDLENRLAILERNICHGI